MLKSQNYVVVAASNRILHTALICHLSFQRYVTVVCMYTNITIARTFNTPTAKAIPGSIPFYIHICCHRCVLPCVRFNSTVDRMLRETRTTRYFFVYHSLSLILNFHRLQIFSIDVCSFYGRSVDGSTPMYNTLMSPSIHVHLRRIHFFHYFCLICCSLFLSYKIPWFCFGLKLHDSLYLARVSQFMILRLLSSNSFLSK